MGSNLRVYWDHLGRTVPLVASAEDAGFPAVNLESGQLRRFWKGISTAEHTLTWDAGLGLTMTLDSVVLPYAAMLVDVGASVALRRSDDMVAWTDVWTLTPIVAGDLVPPDALHYIREESATLTRRGFQIRLYGAMTNPPILGGGIFLGMRTEFPVPPMYGRVLGMARAYRGRDIQVTWPPVTPVESETIASAVSAVTPSAAEMIQETTEGVLYGGIPHWLYDPVGTVLSRTSPKVPMLFPVLCASPEAAQTQAVTPSIEVPAPTRWRERR